MRSLLFQFIFDIETYPSDADDRMRKCAALSENIDALVGLTNKQAREDIQMILVAARDNSHVDVNYETFAYMCFDETAFYRLMDERHVGIRRIFLHKKYVEGCRKLRLTYEDMT